MTIGLIGKKIGMTREFFDTGVSVPVTVLSIEKGRIIDVITISLLTDSMVRYSRTNIRIFKIPRKLIFYVLGKSLFARKFILNIMTNGI